MTVTDVLRGLTRRQQVELAALLLFVVPFVVVFLLTAFGESFEFAQRILIGQADPFAEGIGRQAVVLSILNIFLLPVLLGAAVALVLDYLAEGGPTEAQIEEIVRNKLADLESTQKPVEDDE